MLALSSDQCSCGQKSRAFHHWPNIPSILQVSEELNTSPCFHFLYVISLLVFIILTVVLIYLCFTGQVAHGCCDMRGAADPGLWAPVQNWMFVYCRFYNSASALGSGGWGGVVVFFFLNLFVCLFLMNVICGEAIATSFSNAVTKLRVGWWLPQSCQ